MAPSLCPYDYASVLPSQYVSAFIRYLEMRHLQELEEITDEMDEGGHFRILIDAMDLIDHNVMLGTLLVCHPNKILPFIVEASVEVQRNVRIS